MVRRDGSPGYEVARPVLVRLALELILLAVLLTVGVAGVEVRRGLVARAGPGAPPDVGEGLEGGAGEVLWRDRPYQGLGRAGQRHQGGLHRGCGRRGGGRHQDRLVESVGGAGRVGVEAGRWGLLVSLGGRQLGGRGGLHSSRDDRPGRARALNLTLNRAA